MLWGCYKFRSCYRLWGSGITGGVAFNRNGFYWNFYYGDEFIFAIAHPRMLQLIRESRLEITLELELAPLSLTAGVIR